MSAALDADAVPCIMPMFRLQWEEAQGCHVLLYPEGMVRLNGPAGEILKCCDGTRTVVEIIDDLCVRFPGVESLPDDVYTFLRVAHENQWIKPRPA